MKQNQKYLLPGLQSFLVLVAILWTSVAVHSQPTNQKSKADSQAMVYQQKCGFCHAPKAVTAQEDMKSWIRLLYTSACPDVSLKLTETERQLIKAHLQREFKKLKTDSKKDPEGSSQ